MTHTRTQIIHCKSQGIINENTIRCNLFVLNVYDSNEQQTTDTTDEYEIYIIISPNTNVLQKCLEYIRGTTGLFISQSIWTSFADLLMIAKDEMEGVVSEVQKINDKILKNLTSFDMNHDT